MGRALSALLLSPSPLLEFYLLTGEGMELESSPQNATRSAQHLRLSVCGLSEINIGYDIRYDIGHDIGYDIVNYLLNVLIFDLTIFIQVLGLCSTYSTFHGFSVAVGVRDISSIQLTVRTSAHRVLVDITE
jgi:hypothetical protein